MQYAIVIEESPKNHAVYVPDLAGAARCRRGSAAVRHACRSFRLSFAAR